MRRFSVKGRYEPLMAHEVMEGRGRFRARFMAENLCQVWLHEAEDDDGVIIGVGDGQFEVQADGFDHFWISANSEGRVWVQRALRDQSRISDGSTFTTLDRPPPMSPEMRYMQQIMMANQRMRDEILAERRAIEAGRVHAREDNDRRTDGKRQETREAKDDSEVIEEPADDQGSENDAS